MKVDFSKSGVLSVNYLRNTGKNESENFNNTISKSSLVTGFAYPVINQFVPYQAMTISFMGHNVHIVDAGAHADYMKHFAAAVNKDIDVEMHYSEENPKYRGTKQLKSLEEELSKLEQSQDSFEDEYVAIPALASVDIKNIQDQYERITGKKIKLTTENIKSHKRELLVFLKEIYEHPDKHKEYISYMDSPKQGIEYTYGVIKQINKLKAKGAKVYVPSGHPQELTLKWLAGERGVKDELYHYIATGEDTNNVIHKLHKEIKDNNWYNFNLLSLSDANIVGVKGVGGAQDYMFAAYDSCITDGARGVYNLSPVIDKKTGKILGYSFTDTSTVEYPLSEFPHPKEVKNISQFVGKQLSDVLASSKELSDMQYCRLNNINTEKCANKLYPVRQVFSAEQIKKNKINLKGNYVDRSLKLFFTTNMDGEVIFPKCDCEGSGKPSIYSMWGSCFAVFNAISRDINSENELISKDYEEHIKELKNIINKGIYEKERGNVPKAYQFFDSAIHADRAFHNINPDYYMNFEPYYHLGNLCLKQGINIDEAAAHFNNGINLLADYLINKEKISLDKIRIDSDIYRASVKASQEYDNAIEKYSRKSFISKWFSNPPTKPWIYEYYKTPRYADANKLYNQYIVKMAEMFRSQAIICKIKGEKYPYDVCNYAANCIQSCDDDTGMKILQRRSEGVQYLGDLYDNKD